MPVRRIGDPDSVLWDESEKLQSQIENLPELEEKRDQIINKAEINPTRTLNREDKSDLKKLNNSIEKIQRKNGFNSGKMHFFDEDRFKDEISKEYRVKKGEFRTRNKRL